MSTRAAARARKGAPSRRARRPVEVDDLLRLRIPGDPQLSPDGEQVLFTLREASAARPSENATSIWIAPSDGGSPPRRFTAGPRDSHPRWSPDGRTVAFIRAEPKHRPQIWTIDVVGGEARPLTSFPEGRIASFRWSPDGTRFAASFRATDPEFTHEAAARRKESGASDPPRVLDDIWYRLDGDGYFNGARFALHLVDASTGHTRLLFARDRLGDFGYDWSPDGSTLAVTANTHRRALFEPWRSEILLVDARTGRARPLRGVPEGPKGAPAWSPDGRRLAWAGRADRLEGLYSTENLQLWCAEVAGDRARGLRCLTVDADVCLMAATLTDCADAAFAPMVHWSGDGRRIFTRIGWRGEGHVASIPHQGGALVRHTSGRAEHVPGAPSRRGGRIAVVRSDPTTPPEVHVARVGQGRRRLRLRQVTDFNGPLCKELLLSEPTVHWVRAEDGHASELWVMRPPAPRGARPPRRRRRTPAVLLVHGGPHAMYGEVFFHEMQLLAAQGYTVCFGNPRGSKGYGRDHCAAIRGAWGEKDWMDVRAFAEFMKNDPAIDPRRLAIAGGSYGGYMVNWAIGHTRLFRCAISDRCVSNLISMAGNSDYASAVDEYWPGAPWERWEQRWEGSPIKHIGAARTPTLLIHSEGDLRCNIEQAEQVHAALSVLGVPTRFVRYPASTSHGLSRTGPPDLRKHRLEQMLAWLKRWLG